MSLSKQTNEKLRSFVLWLVSVGIHIDNGRVECPDGLWLEVSIKPDAVGRLSMTVTEKGELEKAEQWALIRQKFIKQDIEYAWELHFGKRKDE